MPAFAWIGAAGAAIVASLFLMLKGGMVERRHPTAADMGAGGGSADGSGIPDLGEDPFKRYPRPRESPATLPEPTQTDTTELSNGPGDAWVSPASGPSVSFASAGDGAGYTYSANMPTAARSVDAPGGGGGYVAPAPAPFYLPPPSGGFTLTPVFAPSPGGGLNVKAA